MASTAVRRHLQQLCSALASPSGVASVLPGLLTLRRPQPSLLAALRQRQDIAALCRDSGPRSKHGAALAEAHLTALKALAQGDVAGAFEAQLLVSAALRGLMGEAPAHNAHLGALQAVSLDLRLLAVRAEGTTGGGEGGLSGGGDAGEAGGDTSSATGPLKRAMGELANCFRAVGTDRNEDVSMSKKLGMIFLFNHLFCIAFRINNFAFLNPLIKMMDREKQLTDRFALAHRVTYRYYMGRKAMYDANYPLADEHLSFALAKCHKASIKNKRLILIHLIPVNLLLGRLPKPALLEHYNLQQFGGIVQAVRVGDLKLLQQELDTHQSFFMQWGIYLLLEKLKLLAYRNLFKRVYILNGKSAHVRLDLLLAALAAADDEDVDMDEVECILANLIHQRYIRGYIAHAQKVLVCSKDNAFPLIRKQ